VRYTVTLDLLHDDPHSEPADVRALVEYLLNDPEEWPRLTAQVQTVELAE
jgi:hypothetical protein